MTGKGQQSCDNPQWGAESRNDDSGPRGAWVPHCGKTVCRNQHEMLCFGIQDYDFDGFILP